MQKKLKPSKTWIKKGPLKTFLFFLAFSAIIWLFVQFSKRYTVIVEFPVTYQNVPKDRILLDQPTTLNVSLRANGFNITYYKLFRPHLNIDLNEASDEEGKLILDLEEQKASVLTELNADYENFNFIKETIQIPYQQRAVKKVAVIPNLELNFAPGYSAVDSVLLQPDSVRVSGPENVLDTLQMVKTKSRKISNISQDVSGNIKLDTSGLGKLTFYKNEVEYIIRTDKFTEGQATVPIELINVPENTNIVIFPKELTVYYQVSLKKFEEVKPTDFRVTADFEEAEKSDGYLLAKLVQKPEIVNSVRLSDKKIQFVIKR